ncbi:DUF2149 [Candidatus Magnetomoraceae bacterium gMMP-13]
MRYFKKKRSHSKAFGDQAFADDDPLTGVANLFDIGLVFIVGLILTLFVAYHLQDLFNEKSDMTIMKQNSNGEMEIITKKGKNIKALKMTKEKAKGQGERLGIAYKLDNGTFVYVPDSN